MWHLLNSTARPCVLCVHCNQNWSSNVAGQLSRRRGFRLSALYYTSCSGIRAESVHLLLSVYRSFFEIYYWPLTSGPLKVRRTIRNFFIAVLLDGRLPTRSDVACVLAKFFFAPRSFLNKILLCAFRDRRYQSSRKLTFAKWSWADITFWAKLTLGNVVITGGGVFGAS